MNPQEAYKKLVSMYSSRVGILLFEIQNLKYLVWERGQKPSDRKVAKALMHDYKTLREKVAYYSNLIVKAQESSTLPSPG